MFTDILAAHVRFRTRSKGLHYFRSGAVIKMDGAEFIVQAVVRGSRDYRVELQREPGRFTGSCECPYYADRGEICKHIWAALLDAERRQLLSGSGPVEADAVLEPDYHPPPVDGGNGARYPSPAGKPGSAAPPTWQRFLTELQQDVAAAESSVPLPRFSNGEIIYTIDVRGTLAGGGTVVTVLFRQRR